MKCNVILASAIVMLMAAAASCNKNEAPAGSQEFQGRTDGEMVELSVGAGPRTKLDAVPDYDAEVKNIQVYVFDPYGGDGDGVLTGYGSCDSNGTVSLKTTTGDKVIYVLVNHKKMLINDLQAFETGLFDIDDNSEANGFVMMGKVEKTISAAMSLEVPVSRVVARVILKKITKMTGGSIDSMLVNIESIYVSNVVRKCQRGGDWPDVRSYYNTSPYSLSKNRMYAHDDFEDEIIANGKSYSKESVFYVLPNDNTDRVTRLVVAAYVNGVACYYPIDLGDEIVSNTSYEIDNIKISRTGSYDPNEPVTSEQASFTVKVKDWLPGGNVTEPEF